MKTEVKRQGEKRAQETRMLTQRPRHWEADKREILKRVYAQERGKRDRQREAQKDSEAEKLRTHASQRG